MMTLLLIAFVAQDPDRHLTGVEKTDHFAIHFRAGSRAAASVDRVKVMAERDFVRIISLLKVEPEGDLHLYLYDDVQELVAITGTSGNAGYSSENKSHIPYDDDQTRFHEMVHLIAHRMAKSGKEARNLFFAEGLANALLEYVHGVHVHAVAAYEQRLKALPAIAEMTGAPDFYAWMVKHPAVPAYDVAASFIRHLIDTHGIDKVKAYYTGTPAKDAFGLAVADLEGMWLKHLSEYWIRPEVETLLKRRRGEDARFRAFELDPDKRLPPELLGKPAEWKALGAASMKADKAKWKRVGDALQGTSDSTDWAICLLSGDKSGNVAVRARIKPVEGCGAVQIQLGPKCQGMLTNTGTFVWKDGVVAQETAERITGRKEIDLVLERRGGVATVWLDGFKIAQGTVGDDTGPVGIGVAGGTALFENVRVRELK